MSRRGAGLLLQPNRRRTAGETPGGAGRRDRATSSSPPLEPATPEYIDLPEHEQLTLPLSDDALRKLAEFANRSATTRTYETQLKKSADLLREAVGNVNDALAERAAQLQDSVERRHEQGREQPSALENDLDRMTARLTEAVEPLTQSLERAARQTIDRQMALEDAREALGWTAQQLSVRRDEDRARARQRQQAREQRVQARCAAAVARAVAAAAAEGADAADVKPDPGDDGDNEERTGRRTSQRGEGGEGREQGEEEGDEGDGEEDEEDDEPPTSARELLEQARATRQAEYEQLTAYRKYALNNDYVAFKQLWHDAKYQDGDVPLPDATAWFDATGEPAPYGPDAVLGGRRGGGDAGADEAEAEADGGDGGGEDSGDDIVVAREVISFNCPLTLVPMTDPYTSRVCKHTFEKEAILEHLRHGSSKCPQTGCNSDMNRRDLVPDKVMRRKIERAAQLVQRRNEMDLDDDDEATRTSHRDLSMVEGPSRNVKREMRRKVEDGM